MQDRIGPAACGKSQIHCKSSQGRVPARSAPLKTSHGAVTETGVGSALHGIKSASTNSLAHLAVDFHTAARAAETRVFSVALLRGAEAAPYMEAGILLAFTK